VFRQTYPLFKSWAMRSHLTLSLSPPLGKYYIGYIYKYTCPKVLSLSIPIHLNTKYMYILCQRHATSSTAGGEIRPLIVVQDSHFVYLFGWFKYISMHVLMLPMIFFCFSFVIQLYYLRIVVLGYA